MGITKTPLRIGRLVDCLAGWFLNIVEMQVKSVHSGYLECCDENASEAKSVFRGQ